ncbi:hypothetical protein [Rhizomonospora bruguierae]|uniref:hypothetical protein n=1 Tax=Rhizomonospora bruguierae TaxID=1581705 RepID=UPI001BCCEAA8|nr:hypothetical protein [Micromonospora sp. NBRC 107566]
MVVGWQQAGKGGGGELAPSRDMPDRLAARSESHAGCEVTEEPEHTFPRGCCGLRYVEVYVEPPGTRPGLCCRCCHARRSSAANPHHTRVGGVEKCPTSQVPHTRPHRP